MVQQLEAWFKFSLEFYLKTAVWIGDNKVDLFVLGCFLRKCKKKKKKV